MRKQKRIVPPPSVLVVEASAGSGKTYSLARRYVRLLLRPGSSRVRDQLRHILAITFTNKAAIEMKERIIGLLKSIALGSFADKAEKKQTLAYIGLDEAAAAERAGKAMDGLVRDYDYFQVRTIDSFISSLITGFSFPLGISPDFIIKKDSLKYLEYGLESFIDRAADDEAAGRVFRDFITQFLFIENRESWMPRNDMLGLVAALFSVFNTFGLGMAKYTVSGGDIIKKKKAVLEAMGGLYETLPDGTEKRFREILGRFLDAHPDNFDVKEVSDYFGREKFPVTKKYDTPAAVGKIWKKIRVCLKELCEWQAFSAFNCYIDIFDWVLNGVTDLAGREGVLFLEELNSRAAAVFRGRGVTPGELSCRLGVRIDHFLIDEFQDTSALQWANLRPMITGALSGGGSLFYVGDKKQAIFRFRGGDAGLFDSAAAESGISDPDREALRTNFRSGKAIVEFNNEVFSKARIEDFAGMAAGVKAPLTRPMIEEITGVFRDESQNCPRGKGGGYVRAVIVDAGDRDERDRIARSEVLRLAGELCGRFMPGDVAILTRSNDDAELVTSWLLEEGISVNSDRTLSILRHRPVIEVISLLKFLVSPIDDIAFAAFITGEVFAGASSLSRDGIRRFIFEADRKRGKDGGYLYKKFRVSFADLWDRSFSDLFRSAGVMPLYETVVNILMRFGAIERFRDSQGFFARLLELAGEKERECADLASFVDFIENAREEDLYVRVKDPQSVNVLTVHQAKGLEFGACIIPFLTIGIKPGQSAGGGYGRAFIAGPDNAGGVRLFSVNAKYVKFSEKLAELYAVEYKKAIIDELNITYVALTRAREELYVYVPRKGPRGDNPAAALIPESVERGERLLRRAAEPAPETKTLKIPVIGYGDWLAMVKDNFVKKGDLAGRKSMRRGEILHLILSHIDNLYGSRKSAAEAVDAAVVAARFDLPNIKDLSEYASIVRRAVEHPGFRPFFFVKDGQVFQEKDIVNSKGEAKRIDRLIVRESECVIIDYKSAHTGAPGDREQVEEYKSIVGQIYPKAKVKAFILYLDDTGMEEI
ncbi:MAG: UvrD-helicase domain-containing protein [Candidatus Omnitrophota bacterium]